jgi:hypothetical protein
MMREIGMRWALMEAHRERSTACAACIMAHAPATLHMQAVLHAQLCAASGPHSARINMRSSSLHA